MIWAEMDYDERLVAVARLARDGNTAGDIAEILVTGTNSVREIAHQHSIYVPSHREGHPVPEPDDPGLPGDGGNAARWAVWRRATEGARATLDAANECRTKDDGEAVAKSSKTVDWGTVEAV